MGVEQTVLRRAGGECGVVQRVRQWFFSFPVKEIGLSELAGAIKASKNDTSKAVVRLLNEGFLTRQVAGKTWRLSCNQRHPYNTTTKVANHLALLEETGVVDLIRRRFPQASAIILFGSYRRGDDTEKSDVDVAVEVAGAGKLRIEHLGDIPQLGYRKNVPVNAHIFSRKGIDLNLFSNIANGIVLDGFLEVRP